MFTAVIGLFVLWPFVPWSIRSIDYFDIFCFIKAERVQSNHMLLDPKYYVFKQNLTVVFQ